MEGRKIRGREAERKRERKEKEKESISNHFRSFRTFPISLVQKKYLQSLFHVISRASIDDCFHLVFIIDAICELNS